MSAYHDLVGQSVMVTGGSGFVGSSLVRELLKTKANIVVYDNFLHGTVRNLEEVKHDIHIVSGDVLEEQKLLQTIREFGVKYVFHCVGDAYVPTTYDYPKRAFRINVEGTLNVLMMSRILGVNRVLYVSSTEVYGEALQAKINETHATLPLNTYAVSKLAADRLCFTLFHEHNVPVVIARIFNTYGPRDTQPRVIPDIISQLSRGKLVELGNIKARRDFVYVDDTARGLIAVMQSRIPNGDVVNIGTGQTWSIEETAKKIGTLMGHNQIEIRTSPERLRRLDIEVFCCDPKKIIDATGWRPTVSFDEGLRKTVEWFNANARTWSWYEFTEGPKTFR